MKKSILLLLVLCLSIPLTPFLVADTAVADDPVDIELISVDFRSSSGGTTPVAGGVFVMSPRIKNISTTKNYHVKAVFGYAFDKDRLDDPSEWAYDVKKYPESPSPQSQDIDWAGYENWEEDFPFETPLLEPVFETPVEAFTVVDLPFVLETDRDSSPGEYNVPYVIFYREWITDENGDGQCDAGDEYGDWQHISRLKTIRLAGIGQDSFVDVDETVVWVDLDSDRELDWVGQDEDGNWNDDANENGYMDPGEGEVRGAIAPGESFYLTLRMENKGTFGARNIQVKLAYEETRPETDVTIDYLLELLGDALGVDLSGLLASGGEATSEYQSEMPFTPVDDSVEFIQALEPGQEAEAVFALKATGSAQSDLYKVPVSILFEDDSGSEAPVVMNMLGVEIGSMPRFAIAGVTTDPSTIRAGDRYTIEIQLENIGSQVARSVLVSLFDGEKEVSQAQYLGSMEPGTIGIAIFDVEAEEKGLTELGLEISYLQESEGVLIPVDVQTEAVKLDILPKAGISTLTWVVVVLVVIAAVVLGVILWRRRSKGEEDEGEWGGPQNNLWGGGPQNEEWKARTEGEKAGAQSDVVVSRTDESVASLAAVTAGPMGEASTESYRVKVVRPKETPEPVVIEEPSVQPIQYEEEEAEGSTEKRGRLRRMFGWMRPRRPFKRSAVAESEEVAEPIVIEEPLVQPVQYKKEEAQGSTEKRGRLRRMFGWIGSKRPLVISWENVPWSRGTRVNSENGEQWSPNSRIGGLAKDRLMRQETRTHSPEGEVVAG